MLFGVAGGYLIYLAYDLAKDLTENGETSMPAWLQILIAVLFAGIGLALLVFAWKFWKKGRQDHDRNPVNLEEQEARETEEKDTGKG